MQPRLRPPSQLTANTFYRESGENTFYVHAHTANRARLRSRSQHGSIEVRRSGQGREGRRSCGAHAHHHLDELLVVDLAVTVNIRLPDHLINLLVRELLTEVSHDVSQLSSRDETVAVLVEHLGAATISPYCSPRSKHCNTTAARTHTKTGKPAATTPHLEGLEDLLLGVSVLHLARHERQELGEVDGAVAVGVHLVRTARHDDGT